MEELILYNGGGGIKSVTNKGNNKLNRNQQKIKRLKERIKVFTEELKKLEDKENKND